MAKSKKEIKQTDEQVVSYGRDLAEFSRWGLKNDGILTQRDRAQRYYKGEHAVKNRDVSLGNYVFNKFAQIARSRTAHIVAKRPKWRFMPVQEGAIFTAEALQDIMNVMWNKIKWDKKGEECVNEARDAGSSHVKLFIRDDGFPDAIPLTADEVILDPKAKRKSHLRYWGHVYPMGTEDIKRTYGKEVEPDMELETMRTRSVTAKRSYMNDSSNTAPISAFTSKYKEGNSWLPDIIGRATVYELWIDDKTIEGIPFSDAEVAQEHENLIKGLTIKEHPQENHPKHAKGHEKFIAQLNPETDAQLILILTEHIKDHLAYPDSTTRRKYPFGRQVIFTGNTLLSDKPNPYAAEMRVGIDFRDLIQKWDYDSLDGYWGKPGVADLFDPQDIFNHRVNAITQGINRLNHGIKKIRKGANTKIRGGLEKLANWVGVAVTVSHPDDITIDYGPQMPGQIFDNLIHTENFMDVVSDKTDILSGQFPKGSPPGVTVNQLLGEGMKPINLIVKHYAEFLQEMGRVMMRLMIDFVPEETKFRIVDDKNKYQYVNWEQVKQQMGYYDIHVDVDSMLATSRQEKLDTALKLEERGIYDREQVLSNLDDPDKHEVMQRIGERQILQRGLSESQELSKFWEGQFRNLGQNYNRLSLELDKERMKNNERDKKK